ncbi:bifunctional DNA primase/polymerase [Nonomuraea sp. NPDC055795]
MHDVTTNPLVEAALDAAARGWQVFPLTPGGKFPVKGFTAWETNAGTNPTAIRRFWTTHPRCNVGIATGPSDLVVIDLDRRKPGQSPPPAWANREVSCGADVLAVLAAVHGRPYPGETFTVRTRSGGIHLYFQAPGSPRLRSTRGEHGNGLGWLIDTRAWGGAVVGPGSFVTAPDGSGLYEVTNPAPVAPLPDWLTEALSPQPNPNRPHSDGGADLPLHHLSRYGEAALNGEIHRVSTATLGQRNRTLNLAAWKLGKLVAQGVLPEHVVTAALQRAAEVANDQGDPNSPREITAVIASGLSAGMKAPPRRRRVA